MIDLKPLNDVRCELGEGPAWDERANALYQADIINRTIYRFGANGAVEGKWTFPSPVGSLGLTESGKLVVALRHTVGIFDPANGNWRAIAEIETEKGDDTRLNDGKVGPDGAFWVGSMDDRPTRPRAGLGSLYRVTADGKVEKKRDGLQVSNGLAFSPDGKTMFHSDSSGGWLDRWDLDPATGRVSNQKRIVDFAPGVGSPDGGATDADGNYWSAGITAQCLNKFAPDGRLLEKHPVPVFAPTMPCFGGKDLRTLYLTSLRVGRPADQLAKYPLTGITLVGAAPVAGSPVSRFRDR
ncbi:MAG TPA: SMP-30/gluconolactonase/LRE family protein [Bauldia sp.]|nr:SMP-30/gluconolactonase/LRE family protein [Bauldia sp.]